jgi:hypothetical protein
MAAGIPDWLKSRGGELRPSKDGHSTMVYFAGQPQYLLEPLPADGKLSCRITQTINGKRLDGKGRYASRDEAFQGGLDELRNILGW